MPWTPIDDLTLDDQVAKMIGPIPPSPFSHRKIEIRKLQVAGYNGFKKNIQEEFNVEFKSEYQIGNGRFGKVYRGTSLDNSTVFAFKGMQESLISDFTLFTLFQHAQFQNRDRYRKQNRGSAMSG